MTVYLLLWMYQVSDPHDQLPLTAAAMPAQQVHPLRYQRAGNTRGMNFRNTGVQELPLTQLL
jgi:hypothetical protein